MYTPVENDIIERMMGLKKISQIKILMCVIRFTAGFHRQGAEMSASYISKFTGLTERCVWRELPELEKNGFITRIKPHPGRRRNTICLVTEQSDSNVRADRGVYEQGFTGYTERRDRTDTERPVIQEINNININNIPNKESKETHTYMYSHSLKQSFDKWCEIHSLGDRSRKSLEKTIDSYVSSYGDEAVADIINQCISEGRGCIYFDRLKNTEKTADNTELENFTWDSIM